MKKMLIGTAIAALVLVSACSLTDNSEAELTMADLEAQRPYRLGDPCAPEIAQDLHFEVTWGGVERGWQVLFVSGNTDPETGEPYVCRGRQVHWAIGGRPAGEAGRYFAWFHIAPDPFTNVDSTGFAVLDGSRGLSLSVAHDTTPDTLYYAALCVNPLALSEGLLQNLDQAFEQEDLSALLRFSRLTFASEDSPPKVIIR